MYERGKGRRKKWSVGVGVGVGVGMEKEGGEGGGGIKIGRTPHFVCTYLYTHRILYLSLFSPVSTASCSSFRRRSLQESGQSQTDMTG